MRVIVSGVRMGFSVAHLACLASLLAAVPLVPAMAQAQTEVPVTTFDIAEAQKMMKAVRYASAVKILEKLVQDKGEEQAGAELRMIGECYYLLKDYGNARTAFGKALQFQTTENGKIVCESRLAMVSYRLKDFRASLERIENFLRKYPGDERAGSLLVIRMKIIAAGRETGAAKIAQLEPIEKQVHGNAKKYGHYIAALASQVLGEQYIEAGNEDKAISVFVSAAHGMLDVITQHKRDGSPLPKDLMEGFDGMCTRIGQYYLDRKNWPETEKWLQNVGYMPEMVLSAKLLLAQMAFQRGEYDRASSILSKEYLEMVPDGPEKWNMHLLLGFCFRDRKDKDFEQAKQHFKLVAKEAKAYLQAQHALGEIYTQEGDWSRAEQHFNESIKSSSYAPPALLSLAKIYFQRASQIADNDSKLTDMKTEFRQKAAGFISELSTKYSLTKYAQEARNMATDLEKWGVKVVKVSEEEESMRQWEKTIQEQSGSNEAAQAIISLARFHAKETYDTEGATVLKAPDWAKCATMCDLILKNGEKPYDGVTAERWQEYRAICAYLRGKAELASLPRGRSYVPPAGRTPVFVAGGGTAAQAVTFLELAKKLAKPTDRDFQRDLEMSLLESMFKSHVKKDRERAEARYEQLREEYSGDPRYQKLALDLADWFVDCERLDLAADVYYNVSRNASVGRDQMLHLLHLSGMCYSKAARAAQKGYKSEDISCGLYIRPKAVLPQGSLLQTHLPFQTAKAIAWERNKELTAEEVLRRISKEYGVPFIWSPDPQQGGVADWLKFKKISSTTLDQMRSARPMAEYVKLLLDPDRFVLDFDIGVSGGKPTIDIDEMDKLDQGAQLRSKVVEIVDSKRERFRAAEKPYDWAAQGGGKVMMFHVVAKVEKITGAKVLWADTVSKDDMLAKEYTALPGASADLKTVSCAEVLRRTLDPLQLACDYVRRDRAAEWFDKAMRSFNELRQFGTDTKLVEKAMFQLAINYYYQDDFDRMKLILREYLKIFDSPAHPNYLQACFWLGWTFEHEQNYREAVKRYTQAADESVVLFKRAADVPMPSKDDLKKRLSYDTLMNIETKASGHLAGYDLGGKFVKFIRFNTNIELKLDPSAREIQTLINGTPFMSESCFDVLYEVMKDMGLDLRTENVDKESAERAYYRLAAVYKADNQLREALEHLNTMLMRFPDSRRKVDALKLKLDIYKGLKDYGNVLITLDALKVAAQGTIEAYKLDYETARVYYDMCDFGKSVGFYRNALSACDDPGESVKIRDAYARALFMIPEQAAEALSQYSTLMKEEQDALRLSIDGLMISYLQYALGHTRGDEQGSGLPPAEQSFIKKYEEMPQEKFEQLSKGELARATWIYYTIGLRELKAGQLDKAVSKFKAAGNSPDDYLAGEALISLGLAHIKRGEVKEARDILQYVLVAAAKSVPAAVRATYHLAVCHRMLSETDQAIRRLKEVIRKFPVSPYAQKAKEELDGIEKPRPDERPVEKGIVAPGETNRTSGAGVTKG